MDSLSLSEPRRPGKPSVRGAAPQSRGSPRRADRARPRDDAASVDDLAPLVGTEGSQALLPRGERLGRQPGPFGDLADDPERGATAVRPGGVAGELLVGDV